MATYAQFVQMGPYFSGGALQAGVQVYHYMAGTTTLKNVYTDRAKLITAAQPVVADSQGIVSFYADGIYKFVIKDSSGTTLYTYDNVNVADVGITGEGAALSSASTVTLGTDGTYFHVTGAVTITALNGTQSFVTLCFDSTPTLTHSGSLILLGQANYTATAGDVLVFVNDGSDVWREVSRGSYNLVYSVPSTGDVKMTFKTTADPGWIIMNDGSIGDATSGATTRANSDTLNLYTLLWTNVSDQWAPVATGRGITAAGDYAAHKAMTLPKTLGRALAGYGVGTTVETVTTSSSNGFVVNSNNTKWITGMPVIWSALSGFTTSGTTGVTYYVVRQTATNVRFATTLALAQAVNPDVTISGGGSCTFTYTFTTRALGESAGEETHAINKDEALAHTHTERGDLGTPGYSAAATGGQFGSRNTGSFGGNTAMNIIQPTTYINMMVKL